MLLAEGGGRSGLRTFRRADLGQPEIENFCVTAVGDEEVGGLDVAMNDALGVGGIEGIRDLDPQVHESIGFERPAEDRFPAESGPPGVPSQ